MQTLSQKEAAEHYRVSYKTIERYIKKGKIEKDEWKKEGKNVLINIGALDREIGKLKQKQKQTAEKKTTNIHDKQSSIVVRQVLENEVNFLKKELETAQEEKKYYREKASNWEQRYLEVNEKVFGFIEGKKESKSFWRLW